MAQEMAADALFQGEHVLDYLGVWKAALIGAVQSDMADLNNRQLALMLIVYTEAGPHTVRALAARLGVGKPVITRALDALGKRDLVRRKADMADRRNLFVQRTIKGAVYLSEFAEFIARGAAQDATADRSPKPKAA